jgi:hypothetical protein
MTTKYEWTLASVMRESDIERIGEFMWQGDELPPEKKYRLFVTAHFGCKYQEAAEIHAAHFRNKLDRAVLGRGKRLYKAFFVEQGAAHSFNQRHAHWLIEKPTHTSTQQFMDVFQSLWLEVCGSSNVLCKPIQKKKGGLNGLVAYLTKERDRWGELGSASFVPELSDNQRLQNCSR